MIQKESNDIINRYNIDYKEASEFYHSRKYKEAIDKFINLLNDYNDIISLDQKAGIYHQIGCLYSELFEHDNAIKFFDKVLQIDPKSAETWYQKGWSYNCKGWAEFDLEALECYEKALEIDPEHERAEDAHFNLMDLIREHGWSSR